MELGIGEIVTLSNGSLARVKNRWTSGRYDVAVVEPRKGSHHKKGDHLVFGEAGRRQYEEFYGDLPSCRMFSISTGVKDGTIASELHVYHVDGKTVVVTLGEYMNAAPHICGSELTAKEALEDYRWSVKQ